MSNESRIALERTGAHRDVKTGIKEFFQRQMIGTQPLCIDLHYIDVEGVTLAQQLVRQAHRFRFGVWCIARSLRVIGDDPGGFSTLDLNDCGGRAGVHVPTTVRRQTEERGPT